MKHLLIVILFLSFSCKESVENTSEVKPEPKIISSSDLEIYDYNGLKPLINKKDDKVHVVNFWATWCGPCIKELPSFEKINAEYANKNVEVLLVSLDFPRQYETKLKPFLKNKNITSKNVCLDDTNQNMWIPAIDTSWSGAIPATIIYKGNNRKFFEKSFTYIELQKEVEQFLN